MYCISTFYNFIEINDIEDIQRELKIFCSENDIKGTIILDKEGINGTIAGIEEKITSFQNILAKYLNIMNFQRSKSEFMPFQKMKIKIKKEIVTFGLENLDMSNIGQYITTDQWDDLISNPNVKVIDTRNYYETALGTFKNAISPNTNNFSDFIGWAESNLDRNDLDKPIAMFCTGGIRCEKATAYVKHLGFKNVYHLKSGIIGYLKSKQNQENMWSGSCFIFDERIMLDYNLAPINSQ